MTMIEEHNRRAADIWSAGGDAYNEISHQIASALDHCTIRVAPRNGERILDLATGTGWTSRLLARSGAKVTGADIAPDLLAAATARAQAESLDIDYQVADAEKLPFPDSSFDAVVSTFGVMFTGKPEAAAAEMSRVCRTGGRIGLTTWPMQGNVYKMFMVLRPYMPQQTDPPAPSPFAWGDRDYIGQLLGHKFDLRFEEGVTTYYDRNGIAAWEAFVSGYGPTKALASKLDEAKRLNLQRDFTAFHDEFTTSLGIAVPREYLLAIGTRR